MYTQHASLHKHSFEQRNPVVHNKHVTAYIEKPKIGNIHLYLLEGGKEIQLGRGLEDNGNALFHNNEGG